MGYDGLVLTDDMDMGAIKKYFDITSVIKQTFTADIDLTLICHKGPNIEKAFDQMLSQIKAGKDKREKALASVERIMKTKLKFLSYTSF